MLRSPRSRARPERGSAVVDFVLVSLILVPLVLGIIQLGLVLHVRNTLASAAAEGARHAATADRGPAAGIERTRVQIRGALADRFADAITARDAVVDGVPVVRVRVEASVPPLGLWGPPVRLDVAAHSVAEAP